MATTVDWPHAGILLLLVQPFSRTDQRRMPRRQTKSLIAASVVNFSAYHERPVASELVSKVAVHVADVEVEDDEILEVVEVVEIVELDGTLEEEEGETLVQLAKASVANPVVIANNKTEDQIVSIGVNTWLTVARVKMVEVRELERFGSE
ncbi:hypothetical protein BX600DRAFT_438055 [Xylariales sp. PMI_506]|nr:hypothetical protein BX600DRAFT_438055 [Xylariales sp. PMI_506]